MSLLEKINKDKVLSLVTAIVFFAVLVVTYKFLNPLFLRIEKEKQAKEMGIAVKDEHGCLRLENYRWCDSKQKCINMYKEECYLAPEDKERIIKDFLIDNLHSISPEKEIGGKFLVKNCNFKDNNRLIIDYGNEFLFYTADISYFLHDDGGVGIKEFNIIKKAVLKEPPND